MVLVLAAAPARAGQEAEFVLGSGNGIATTVKAGPQTGGLTVAVTFGQALADFQGRVARASSRAIDFGVIELALTAPGCFGGPASFQKENFPQPLDADSRDPASNEGKTEVENGSEPGEPVFATLGRKHVKAVPTPESRAETATAAFGVAGVLEVGPVRSEVISRVVDDTAREVLGTVDVAYVELLGGMIRMTDLHWEALHRTGKDPESTGTFSFATLAIGGVPVPVPSGAAEAALLLAPVNAILLGTGLSLEAPVLDTQSGAANLTPLTVRLASSPLGQAVVAPAVTAGQDVREAFFNLYYDLFECGGPLGEVQYLGSVGRGAVLPSDIALSALTGTGGFVIELGGVRALTEGQTFEDPFAVDGGAGPSLDVGGVIDALPSADVLGASFGTGTESADVGAPAGAAADDGDGQAALAGDVGRLMPGSRGGAALAIGLIGLVVVMSVAAADYFHMRRGRRVIPEID